MESFFQYAGYVAVGYCSLFILYRVLISTLVIRHVGECLSGYSGTAFKAYVSVFMVALLDNHTYVKIGNKIIYWRRFHSRARWDSIRESSDTSFWCKTVADGHEAGHNFFELNDKTKTYVMGNDNEENGPKTKGRWVEKDRKAYVDICERKISLFKNPVPVVYVEIFGDFDSGNDPDKEFIRFLVNHFQRIVVIRIHNCEQKEPFYAFYQRDVEMNGEKFIAIGVDLFEEELEEY